MTTFSALPRDVCTCMSMRTLRYSKCSRVFRDITPGTLSPSPWLQVSQHTALSISISTIPTGIFQSYNVRHWFPCPFSASFTAVFQSYNVRHWFPCPFSASFTAVFQCYNVRHWFPCPFSASITAVFQSYNVRFSSRHLFCTTLVNTFGCKYVWRVSFC